MTPRFDPTRAIKFDLARGQMRDDEGTARVNLPAHVLLRLCEQAGESAQKDFAQGLGSDVGRRIVERLGKAMQDASVEAWTEHLGGQLALLGLGDLSIEQWGKALVLVIDGAPQGTASIVGPLLGAAITRASGRSVQLIAFENESSVSYLVVSAEGALHALELMRSGAGLGQVVEQLHRGAA